MIATKSLALRAGEDLRRPPAEQCLSRRNIFQNRHLFCAGELGITHLSAMLVSFYSLTGLIAIMSRRSARQPLPRD